MPPLRETSPHFVNAKSYPKRWWDKQSPTFFPRWFPEAVPKAWDYDQWTNHFGELWDEGSPVTPSQITTMGTPLALGRKREHTLHYQLAAGVMLQSWVDAQAWTVIQRLRRKQRRQLEELDLWVNHQEHTYICSFTWCCSALGLDIDATRVQFAEILRDYRQQRYEEEEERLVQARDQEEERLTRSRAQKEEAIAAWERKQQEQAQRRLLKKIDKPPREVNLLQPPPERRVVYLPPPLTPQEIQAIFGKRPTPAEEEAKIVAAEKARAPSMWAVTLYDRDTGETKTIELVRINFSWWATGGGSCDCRRAQLMRKYTDRQPVLSHETCLGYTRFVVIDVRGSFILQTKQDLLAEMNQQYPVGSWNVDHA